ncbi:MAG: hypothetical protein ACR2P2_22975 [Nakamurella sp.]
MTGIGATARWSVRIPGGQLGIAAALAVLSLGLPWTTDVPGTVIPGRFIPGSCGGYGELICTPGILSASIYLAGRPAVAGYETTIRVFALLAGCLIVIGLRQSRRWLLIAGVTIAMAGWLDNIGSQAGELVYLMALVALLVAVKDRLALPHHRSATRQPSTASTSPATSRILSSSTAPWRST